MITKNCVICGKEFLTKPSKSTRKCCSKTCAGVYRKNTYGCTLSEETRKQNAERMKMLWADPKFRAENHRRMTQNNPTKNPETVKKIRNKRLEKGNYYNCFKYGNGTVSPYEYLAMDYLRDFDFIYNYSISVRSMQIKYPERHYPTNYKPDFTNTNLKLCIEIDGPNHKFTMDKDNKKDECLKELGYTVYRFTHEDIDTGRFYKEIDKLWQNYYQFQPVKKLSL